VSLLYFSRKSPKSMLIINILTNIFVGAVKWIGGIFGNSQALLADALETSSDIVSSTILLIGYDKSTQPADQNHPYGHGKLEAISSFIIGIVLIFSAALIIYESTQSLLSPHKEIPKTFTVYVVVAVILVKEILYRIFKALSIKFHSSLFKNEAMHHRTDVLTSIITLSGIAISLLPNGKFWYGDQLAAIMASAIILYNAYRIIRNSLSELMDEQTFPEVSSLVEKIAEDILEIDSYEKCYVRKSGNKYYCDIHIRVDANFSVKKGHDIAHLLKNKAQTKNRLIQDVHIHVEPTFCL
jgi:cation diffusion facilitator family transporter